MSEDFEWKSLNELESTVDFIDDRLIVVEQDIEDIFSRLKIMEDSIKNG